MRPQREENRRTHQPRTVCTIFDRLKAESRAILLRSSKRIASAGIAVGQRLKLPVAKQPPHKLIVLIVQGRDQARRVAGTQCIQLLTQHPIFHLEPLTVI